MSTITRALSTNALAGKEIAFLHGVGRCGRDFQPLLPWTTGAANVSCFDHRGHGDSPRTPGAYLVENYVQDQVAWLKSRPAPVILYGHSLGALVALGAAAQAPDKVRGIILEDPPTHDFLQQIPGTGYEATFKAMQSLAGSKKSVEEIALTFGDTLLPLKNGQTIRLKETRDAPSLRFSADCLRKVDPEVFTPILELRWLEGYHYQQYLTAVSCPALVLVGKPEKGSMILPGEDQWFAKHLKYPQVVSVPEVGHQVHWQALATVGSLLSAFILPLD